MKVAGACACAVILLALTGPAAARNGARRNLKGEVGPVTPTCASKGRLCGGDEDCCAGLYCTFFGSSWRCQSCIVHGDVCGGARGRRCCESNSFTCAPGGRGEICQECSREGEDCYVNGLPCCAGTDCVHDSIGGGERIRYKCK